MSCLLYLFTISLFLGNIFVYFLILLALLITVVIISKLIITVSISTTWEKKILKIQGIRKSGNYWPLGDSICGAICVQNKEITTKLPMGESIKFFPWLPTLQVNPNPMPAEMECMYMPCQLCGKLINWIYTWMAPQEFSHQGGNY